MTTITARDLAGEAYTCFETAKRTDDTEYVRVKDGSPEWVADLVYHAHGDMLPDDWRYQCIMSALECISDSDDPEDAAHEWADAEVDVYTGRLLAWLSSHLSRVSYCDDAISDEQWTTDQGIVGIVSAGQYNEAREVYDLVLRFLEEREEA